MQKTDFTAYSDMPVAKRKKNDKTKKTDKIPNKWFPELIHGLEDILCKDKDPENRKHKKDENYVVCPNKRNAEIIEKKIEDDESYNAHFTEKMLEYYNLKLKESGGCPRTGEEAKGPIQDIIRMIDLENSTNQWRYKEKRRYLKKMVKYIVTSKYKFWNRLKDGDKKLPDDLRAYAFGKQSEDTSEGKDGQGGPRSLASKVCRYFSEYFLKKDNYYINDSVVRHVLPYYQDSYETASRIKTKTASGKLTYEELHRYLDELREKACPDLKRRELDHILWYCYRFEN